MMADRAETHRRLLSDAAAALGTFLLLVVPLALLGLSENAAAIGWSTLMVVSLAFRRVNPLLAVAVCAAAGTVWATRFTCWWSVTIRGILPAR